MKKLLAALLLLTSTCYADIAFRRSGSDVNLYFSDPLSGADEGNYVMTLTTISCVGTPITCANLGNGIFQISVAASGGAGGGGGSLVYYDGTQFISISSVSAPGIVTQSLNGHTSFYVFNSTGNWITPQNFKSSTTFGGNIFSNSSVTTQGLFVSSNGFLVGGVLFTTHMSTTDAAINARLKLTDWIVSRDTGDARQWATELATGALQIVFANFTSTSDARGNTFVNFRSTSDIRLNAVQVDTSAIASNFSTWLSTTQSVIKSTAANLADDTHVINTPGNPVSWKSLKDVPAGFADGTDDGSGGGGAAVAGVIYNGNQMVAFSSIAVPGATITSDGIGMTSFTWTTQIISTYAWASGQFSTAFSSIAALMVSTQNIQAFFALNAATQDVRMTNISNFFSTYTIRLDAVQVDTTAIKNFATGFQSTANIKMDSTLNFRATDTIRLDALQVDTTSIKNFVSAFMSTSDARGNTFINFRATETIRLDALQVATNTFIYNTAGVIFSTHLAAYPIQGSLFTSSPTLAMVSISSLAVYGGTVTYNGQSSFFANVNSSPTLTIDQVKHRRGDGLEYWGGDAVGTSGGVGGAVFGYISTRNIDMAGFAITRSSGISIGTGTWGLLNITSVTPTVPLMAISSGFPTWLTELYASSWTITVPTVTINGTLIVNSPAPSGPIVLSTNVIAQGNINNTFGGYTFPDGTTQLTAASGQGGGFIYNGIVATSFSTFSVNTPFGPSSVASGAGIATATVMGSTNPYRTISLPASAWYGCGQSSASKINGGFAMTSTATAYNTFGEAFHYFDPPASTTSFVCGSFRMPFEWDGSSVAFQVAWHASTGAQTTMGWSFGAVAIASGTSIYQAVTSSVTTFSAFTSSNTELLTNMSASYSVLGNPVPGSRVKTVLNAGGGTFAGFPRMTEVVLYYRQAVWDGKNR